MSIPWELVLSFAAGLAIMALLGYVLLVPMRFFWRMAAGGVLGALVLGLANLFAPFTGFCVSVNPFTALIVGLLGLPGALLVGILSRSVF